MAVTVASSSTAYSASGTSLVITKPSGLAVGDLMLAGIRNDDGGNGITLPSGWTILVSTFNPFSFVYTHYKYADSGDVAASNFTWTAQNSTIMAGGILRVTGASPVIGSAYLAGAQTNTASPSFVTGVTPTRANSLLVIFLFSMQNSNASMGGYAIATSNPTWTEQFDITMASQESFSAAWAVRPQTTSTGAWSATGGTGTSDYNSFLVSINEALLIDVAESTTLTETHKQNQSILKAESVSLTEVPEVSMKKWKNEQKSTTTWVNEDKS
jgi:hypothetical protein